MFLQAPGFTMAVISALTLDIANNTAMFSVIATVLLKPFAYEVARETRMRRMAPAEADRA